MGEHFIQTSTIGLVKQLICLEHDLLRTKHYAYIEEKKYKTKI